MKDDLDMARRALDDADWQAALDHIDVAERTGPTAESIELRAQASYGNGDFEAAVAAWEDLHQFFVTAGDPAEAARAAAMIAMYLMMDTGLMAPVRGWLRRAERLLGDAEPTAAAAIIAMVRTYERFMCGDMDAARDQSAKAIELGERLDVRPAVVIGMTAAARVKVFDGHVQEGLDLLDEVGAVLMSGGADPLTTGMMYCELICAAQGLALHRRASEWTDVMENWRHGTAFGGINGRCRVHRAEVLKMTGPCDAAEEEALGACDELRPWMRREFGWPLVELACIRLRKGDLSGAEEAFVAAHEHAWSPHPGFALLRLEQGDVETARALIDQAIAHPFEIPSKERPPYGELRFAPLYDALAEIATAAGDVAAVEHAARRLSDIAGDYPSPSLAACADLARGRAALAGGRPADAAAAAAQAVARWAEVGAPYETGRARMVLADAHDAMGHHEAARLERTTAQAGFESFGAMRWAARAAGATPRRASSPARTPDNVFRADGDMRTVAFRGTTVHVKDLKGMRYYARLLAEPEREFHVSDLVAVERGSLGSGRGAPTVDDDLSVGPESGLPALDEQARRAYRRRLAEVDADIDEARTANDLGRLALAERDREYLLTELSHAVGLGGRMRSLGGSTEKARTAVARSLRYARRRLAEHHPEMAAHLDRNVRTGTYCCYEPDPEVSWDI